MSLEYGRLLAEKGKERAEEKARYERELRAAEDAWNEEQEESSLWSNLGAWTTAALMLFAGGPEAAYKGYHWGKEAGKWGRKLGKKLTGTEYDPSDHAISTDVGRFDVSQKGDLEDVNIQFEDAHDSQFWKDLTGTGVSALSLFYTPENLAGEEWWTMEDGGAPDWLRLIRGTGQQTPGKNVYTGTSLS